jgi:hypothetical protein
LLARDLICGVLRERIRRMGSGGCHRRAVRVLERHERDGVPFALMLRAYGITQVFPGPRGRPGQLFENILFEAL